MSDVDQDLIDLEFLDNLLHQYDCMPLIMLDGFFVALASTEKEIMPSQWYEIVGINNDNFASDSEAKQFFDHLNDYHDCVIHDLMHGNYQPLIIDDGDADDLTKSSKLWVLGYMQGLSLDDTNWVEELPDDIRRSLVLLSLYVDESNQTNEALKQVFGRVVSKEELAKAFSKIPHDFSKTINAIFQFQLSRSSGHAQHDHGCGCPSHSTPSVGRNDPCPCGSGKKYKKCCLH